MTRAAQVGLTVKVVVFSFDTDPAVPPARALRVLTLDRRLPEAVVAESEPLADAAARAIAEVGIGAAGKRGGNRHLHLIGLAEQPDRSRIVTLWYYTTVPFAHVDGPTEWLAIGRLRLAGSEASVLKPALERLLDDTHDVARGAVLLGEVFTGDDLLRVNVALHGGPEGSERTFRRRVQELRDAGVLRPVRPAEVAGLRMRVQRFRSPSGTGGRPPELLRYSGTGGEKRELAALGRGDPPEFRACAALDQPGAQQSRSRAR